MPTKSPITKPPMCAIKRSLLALHTVFGESRPDQNCPHLKEISRVHMKVFDQLTRDVADSYANDEFD